MIYVHFSGYFSKPVQCTMHMYSLIMLRLLFKYNIMMAIGEGLHLRRDLSERTNLPCYGIGSKM